MRRAALLAALCAAGLACLLGTGPLAVWAGGVCAGLAVAQWWSMYAHAVLSLLANASATRRGRNV